jgi:signal transduction histidine kinase
VKGGWHAGGWPHRWHGAGDWPPLGPGAAIAAGCIQVFACAAAARRAGTPLDPAGYALLLIGPLALLVRHRAPVAVLAVAAAATTAYYTLGLPSGPAFVAAAVALVGAVRDGHRTAARWIVTVAYLCYLVAGRLLPGLPEVGWRRALVVAAWVLAAVGLAEAIRIRSAQLAALASARAEQARARAEQQRARVEQQRRQASEERLRIARELHDVLGHHLSLISVQAGVGLHLMDERPEQARAALLAIKQASAEALHEVRSVLAALRPQDEDPPRAPAPGLSEVDELVKAAGLPVSLRVDGAPRPLPPDVDRAAYRIVQEALTNVRRHAGESARAELALEYRPHGLTVRVTDDGVGASPSGDPAGNGIAGMRERATALGGRLRAGPRPGGGFEVVADLPASAPDREPRR